MIDHDYDFDFGIYYTKDKLVELNDFLTEQLKDTPYETLVIDSYAHKIEIWDPTHGVHSDVAPRFFNVIMDLQLYADDKEDDEIVRIQYFRTNDKDINNYKKEWFQNIKTIEFEDLDFPCVSEPEEFLNETYGYIGKNAIFDEVSGKYKKKN